MATLSLETVWRSTTTLEEYIRSCKNILQYLLWYKAHCFLWHWRGFSRSCILWCWLPPPEGIVFLHTLQFFTCEFKNSGDGIQHQLAWFCIRTYHILEDNILQIFQVFPFSGNIPSVPERTNLYSWAIYICIFPWALLGMKPPWVTGKSLSKKKKIIIICLQLLFSWSVIRSYTLYASNSAGHTFRHRK